MNIYIRERKTIETSKHKIQERRYLYIYMSACALLFKNIICAEWSCHLLKAKIKTRIIHK